MRPQLPHLPHRMAKDRQTGALVRRMTLTDSVEVLGGCSVRLVRARGNGRPLLLMAGCGLSLDFWLPVTALLRGGEHHRELIAFDRPGLGGTPWPGHEPTLAQEVATAVAALELLGQPAILVAHSVAAFHAEAVARTRPDLVAGLVLVDGSVEWPAEPPSNPSGGLARFVAKVTRPRGVAVLGQQLWRLGTVFQSERTLGHLYGPRLVNSYREPGALAAATAEAVAYDRQAWDLIVVRTEHPWPPIPTIVLTAGQTAGLRGWVRQHRRLAALLGASQLVVENSKHLMMVDRPDAIVAAIAQIDDQLDQRLATEPA